jgi:hypothetical protein
LKGEDDFPEYFIDRNLKREELQVRYIVASKAINRLYMHVPEFWEASREKGESLNLEC